MTADHGPVATRVKICGLTSASDAAYAERSGAAFLGAILAGGPRLLDVERAREVLGPRRSGVARVAVFGAQTIEEILTIGTSLDLDVVQLHGDPSPEVVRELCGRSNRAVWPVLRVEGTTLPESALGLAKAAGALVLDAKVIGHLGGTGVALDWVGLVDSVRELRRMVPDLQLVLAGGLRAENVTRAVALLQPSVVDVSSGVEISPGRKDLELVERFVSAVITATGTRA